MYFRFLNDEFSALSDKYILDEEQNSKTTLSDFLDKIRDNANLTFLRVLALY